MNSRTHRPPSSTQARGILDTGRPRDVFASERMASARNRLSSACMSTPTLLPYAGADGRDAKDGELQRKRPQPSAISLQTATSLWHASASTCLGARHAGAGLALCPGRQYFVEPAENWPVRVHCSCGQPQGENCGDQKTTSSARQVRRRHPVGAHNQHPIDNRRARTARPPLPDSRLETYYCAETHERAQ